jgi:hypothetical protein
MSQHGTHNDANELYFPLHDGTRTGGYKYLYTYDDGVWNLSIVHGTILCRAVPNLSVTIRNVVIAVRGVSPAR